MRIIKCYIENFGTLSKFSYDFEQLNVVEEVNGWGKTTFSAFLKAMFYGLSNATKADNDRKAYSPWNNGKFGGNMVIELNGRKIKIERYFGKSAKSDSFRAIDLETNSETKDIKDNFGEEIWQIDKDSFEKTAFITLKDSELLSDMISSKLGDLQENEADIDKSTKAVEELIKTRKKIKADRGENGSYYTAKEKINDINKKINNCNMNEKFMSEINLKIAFQNKQQKELTESIRAIEKEQEDFVIYDKAVSYQNLMTELQDKERIHKESKRFFNGRELSNQELQDLKDASYAYLKKETLIEENKLSAEENNRKTELQPFFIEKIPDSAELDIAAAKVARWSALKDRIENSKINIEDQKRFDELSAKYKEYHYDQAMINQMLQNCEDAEKLEHKKRDLEQRRSIMNEKGTPVQNGSIAMFIIGLVLTILGAVTSFLIFGIPFLIAGIIIMVLGWKKYKSGSGTTVSGSTESEIAALDLQIGHISVDIQKLKAGYTKFLSQMHESEERAYQKLINIQQELKEFERLQNNLQTRNESEKKQSQELSELGKEIEITLCKYCNLSKFDRYESALSNIRNNAAEYQQLKSKSEKFINASRIVKESRDILELIFKSYYPNFPESVSEARDEIIDRNTKLENARNNLTEMEAKIQKFKVENDLEQILLVSQKSPEQQKSREELAEQKKSLSDEKEKVITNLSELTKDLKDCQDIVDELEDHETALMKYQEELQELEEQYDTIQKAIDLLESAKENMAKRYMGSILTAFKKYLAEMKISDDENYTIDTRLGVKIEAEGEQHEASELSRGTKDLIEICMRFALVEAVYKDVKKPLLILDDPFVNLDTERVESAKELLQKVSEEYQMIYFVCHESRGLTVMNG